MKERLGLTEIRKHANRMTFAEVSSSGNAGCFLVWLKLTRSLVESVVVSWHIMFVIIVNAHTQCVLDAHRSGPSISPGYQGFY